jgi:Tol biopolymer transport system component
MARWLFAALSLVWVLVACGGGGGGGSAPGGGGPPASATRSGQMAYYFNNQIFGVNMATGVSRLLVDDQDFQLKYVGHGFSNAGELVVAFNVDDVGNNSKLYFYKADGTQDKILDLRYRIVSAPKFSPDGLVIGFVNETQSGQLNVPSDFLTLFIDRSGLGQYGFNYAATFDWFADGRVVVNSPTGLLVYPTPVVQGTTATLVANTVDATVFSISPDGTRIAFSASPDNLTPKHIFMVNADGSGRRQVTTSRIDEENRVLFSPDGKELLVTTKNCTSTSGGSGVFVDADVVQIIPSDATLLDVTATTTANRLQINGNQSICTQAPMSWK